MSNALTTIRTRFVVTVVFLAASAHMAAAAPSYRAILEMYRAGDTAGAVAAVVQIKQGQLKQEYKSLVAEEARAKQAGQPRVWLWTASMVHLECSLHSERSFDSTSLRTASEQLGFARWFARALYPDLRVSEPTPLRTEKPGSDAAFLRAWFRFMVVHDIARGWQELASDDIALGLKLTVSDPEILLAEGARHEVAWHEKNEEGHDHLSFAGDLAAAERALQAAVDAEPGLDEARLRLGRVQTMRGEVDAALRTLATLRPEKTEPGFLYLARLFEGDVYEGTNDLAAAERAYNAAIEVMPPAQSGQVARARLRHASGRRDDAVRDVVALAEGASLVAADDPWLFYRKGVVWRTEGYLDTLRAMARR